MADPYKLALLDDPLDPTKKVQDTSVVSRVEKIANQNSNLNKMAATQGLKVAGRRGMLNSTMAVGAAQDAVLKNAMPIASQDASQAFAGQQAGLDRAHQAGMQDKQIASTERLTLKQIESNEGLAAAQRALDLQMQQAGIAAAEAQQIRDITSREGMAAAERALQDLLQKRSIAAADTQQQRQIAATERLALADIASREGMASAQRALDERMQQASISAAEQQQLRAIASTEGLAAADRALQDLMQQRGISSQEGMAAADRALQQQLQANQLSAAEQAQIRDIASREGQAAADRVLQEKLQANDIAWKKIESKLDRDLQKQIASWNIGSSERNAAATMVINTRQLYDQRVRAIQDNKSLSAAARETQLKAAKAQLDKEMKLVEQMYRVNLSW